MKYAIEIVAKAKNFSGENDDSAFLNLGNYEGSMRFEALLDVSLQARVLRQLGEKSEIVEISSNGKTVRFNRDVEHRPGDIGASCNPDGTDVSVESLNIQFRPSDDSHTDRGMVWVIPGNPARIFFVIKPKIAWSAADRTRGSLLFKEIIDAAEKAVEQKVLVYFR